MSRLGVGEGIRRRQGHSEMSMPQLRIQSPRKWAGRIRTGTPPPGGASSRDRQRLAYGGRNIRRKSRRTAARMMVACVPGLFQHAKTICDPEGREERDFASWIVGRVVGVA